MGRIKSAAVKRIAKSMVTDNPQIFSTEFEKNKRTLDNIITHKKTKNNVAGYITKLVRRGHNR